MLLKGGTGACAAMKGMVIIKATKGSEIFEMEDFGSEMTPELREQEDRLRVELERQQGA